MLGAKHQFPTPHPPLQMCLQVMEGQPFHEKKNSKLDMRPKDASADILGQEYRRVRWSPRMTRTPLKIAKVTWYPCSRCICPDACR